MRRLLAILGCTTLVFSSLTLNAEDNLSVVDTPTTSLPQPFTGRVNSNRVRMRLNPSLDSQILSDLNKGDLVVVLETADEDFYAIEAPASTEAYVFRTFVLDGLIEGSHVNIRLAPDLTAPVVAQLNTGDRVEGAICAANPKWLKISPPNTIRFYVARDYIEYAGGPEFFTQVQLRTDEAREALAAALTACDEEMSKSFEARDFDRVRRGFQNVITYYAEFATEVEQAEEALASAREVYLKDKINYLEARAELASESWNSLNTAMSGDLEDYQVRLDELEAEIARELSGETLVEATTVTGHQSQNTPSSSMLTDPAHISGLDRWKRQEEVLYVSWKSGHEEGALADFYTDESLASRTITGILERYDRPVKNKPGDYLIIDPYSHQTLGYVYSTRVDLHDQVGQDVTLRVTERPNHNFAFPAYFALAME